MSGWHPPWPGIEAPGSLVLPLPATHFASLPAQLRLHDGLLLGPRGDDYRRVRVHRVRIDLGSAIDEQPHDIELTAFGGLVERGNLFPLFGVGGAQMD